jgi:hypothetical protein
MWKILKTNGLFILITTITEDLLESLVSSILVYYSLEEKKVYNASNWSRGHRKEAMKTDSGSGTVYYYSISKIYNLQERKELIMNSITSLLKEAQQLDFMKEDEEWKETDISTTVEKNSVYERKKDIPLENLVILPQKVRADLFSFSFIVLNLCFLRIFLFQ